MRNSVNRRTFLSLLAGGPALSVLRPMVTPGASRAGVAG
jgi:hypothetical protein